jgi:hypothetical protein
VGAEKRRTRLVVVGLVVLAAGRFRSVVIWCRRFTYAFGAAELSLIR